MNEQTNGFSTTQATNLTAIVGVLVMILNHFKINIGSDDIMAFVGSVMTIGGIFANYFHRYQKGDLTLGGFRKF